jgi:hypothetical protein
VSNAARKSFVDTLRDIRQGATVDELTEHLRAIVTRVAEIGGTGELTVKLKVKRFSKGEGNTLVITDDVKVKLPLAEKGATILFATADGDLQRNDPRQPKLTGLDGGGRATVAQHPAAAAAAGGVQEVGQ